MNRSVVSLLATLGVAAVLSTARLLGADEATGTTNAAVGDYKISPQDVLIIHIIGEQPDFPIEQRVSGEGNINFPFLETVKAAGKTTMEVAALIRKRLIDEEFFVDPQVLVNVKEYRQETVNVFGQVLKPGPVQLPAERRMDIVEAINLAGGFTGKANRSKILLTRKGETRTYSWDKLIRIQDDAEKVWMEPGDTIDVKESIF
jgi:polysaccharide export outer membrane protein